MTDQTEIENFMNRLLVDSQEAPKLQIRYGSITIFITPGLTNRQRFINRIENHTINDLIMNNDKNIEKIDIITNCGIEDDYGKITQYKTLLDRIIPGRGVRLYDVLCLDFQNLHEFIKDSINVFYNTQELLRFFKYYVIYHSKIMVYDLENNNENNYILVFESRVFDRCDTNGRIIGTYLINEKCEHPVFYINRFAFALSLIFIDNTY